MIGPLHVGNGTGGALARRVTIAHNTRIARNTFRLRFDAPDLAQRAVPGQFFMLRLAGAADPLLGRALALYDTVMSDRDEPVGIEMVYLVRGKFTSRLAQCMPGQALDVWGPLGNGFPAEPVPHLVMVAGGIGQTPFLALAREFLGHRRYGQPPRDVVPSERVSLCYGARSAEHLAGVEDFERMGVDVRLATEDGSRGHAGLVTDLVATVLSETERPCRVVCCGPERMMERTAALAAEHRVPCLVSLETPMACGIGICFTCVARIKDGAGAWDYKRTCVEGPVFDAAKVQWQA